MNRRSLAALILLNAVLLPKIWRKEIGLHDLYHAHLWPTHLVDLHPMVWYPHEPLRILNDLRYEQNMELVGQNASRNVHIYPKFNYDRIGDHLYEAYLSSIEGMDKAVLPERIVANSAHTAKYLEDIYNLPVKDIVYPGVDPDNFIDLPVDPNLFITISQLWPHKRVNLLIEAIAMTDDTQLMVIGSGPEKSRLMKIAEQLGVGNRVFFLSGLTNHELRLVLARCCAFLFAAIREPFGIVILEAMAAAKPIIAVNEGGYTEVCRSEFSFLVPPFPSAFAEKISFLQKNQDIAQQMGSAGRQVTPHYSWKRTTNELEKILLDTLQKETCETSDPETNDNPGILVGIQYYLWYGEGFGAAHWNDTSSTGLVIDKPTFGYYGSSKGQTINYHFDLFEQMGLDYVILNLHVDDSGANGTELIGIQHVFDIAEKQKRNLRFVIQIAPYTEKTVDVERVIRMISKLYSMHSNYLHIDGKPVLFWFWSGVHDGDARFNEAVKAAAQQYVNIAVSLRLPNETDESRLTHGMFDGFVPFSPLELSSKDKWIKVWNAAFHFADRAQMKYRIATVCPGYDDSGLDDHLRAHNPYRTISRENGTTYEKSMEFVENLSDPPDLIMISTFNEFHENTHIEPSLKNGTRYIDMTTGFVDRIRHKWVKS